MNYFHLKFICPLLSGEMIFKLPSMKLGWKLYLQDSWKNINYYLFWFSF